MAIKETIFEIKRERITSVLWYSVYQDNHFKGFYYLKFNAHKCIKRLIKKIEHPTWIVFRKVVKYENN